MTYPFSGIIVRYISATGVPPANPVVADELHVNLWEVAGKPFIDIGVMINGPEEIESLQVDLPWVTDKSKIFDLGSRLVGERIVAAIFNEVVHYSGSNDQMFANVTFIPPDPDRDFVLARLSSQDFTVEENALSDGSKTTRLKVRVPTLQVASPPKKLYIRFRIIEVPEDNYTSIFFQKDRSLLSSSLETRIVDFRINVRRGIPDDILTSSTNLRFPAWKKIHVFMTLDRGRELTFSNEKFVDCRSLEDEAVWNSYITLGNNDRNIGSSVSAYLGYQWTSKAKERAPAKDLVALARFSKVTSSKSYVARFLFLALLLGAAGNGIWGLAADFVGKINTENQAKYLTLQTLGAIAIAFFATIYIPPIAKKILRAMAKLWRKFVAGLRSLFR